MRPDQAKGSVRASELADRELTPGETVHRMTRDFRLDGDLLRCTSCHNGQHVFWCAEAFQHRGDCKRGEAAELRPWLLLHDQVARAREQASPRTPVRISSFATPAEEIEQLRARLTALCEILESEEGGEVSGCIGSMAPAAHEVGLSRAVLAGGRADG